MEPFVEPVSKLLTALHQERGLREFQAYYFHNCVYEELARNARLLRRDAVPTGELLHKLDGRWKVILVGDAAMHPAELLEANGNIDPRRRTATRGIDWLQRIKDHFERVVWLNPEPAEEWSRYQTVQLVQRIFPMFHLSVDGIHEAVSALVGARATH